MNEVIFFTSGKYDIGYEFNGQVKYKLRYNHYHVIGAFGTTKG